MALPWIPARRELLMSEKLGKVLEEVENLPDFHNWLNRRKQRRRLIESCCLEIWAKVADSGRLDGSDLILTGLTEEDLDELAGIEGFASSMSSVGWVEIGGGEIRFVNFAEFNRIPSRIQDSEEKMIDRVRKAGEAFERDAPPNGLPTNREQRTGNREQFTTSVDSDHLGTSFQGIWKLTTSVLQAQEIGLIGKLISAGEFERMINGDDTSGAFFILKVAALVDQGLIAPAAVADIVRGAEVTLPANPGGFLRALLRTHKHGPGEKEFDRMISGMTIVDDRTAADFNTEGEPLDG